MQQLVDLFAQHNYLLLVATYLTFGFLVWFLHDGIFDYGPESDAISLIVWLVFSIAMNVSLAIVLAFSLVATVYAVFTMTGVVG